MEPIDKILKVNNGNFTDFSDNSKKLITVQTLKSIGWKVVGVTYMSDILVQTKVYMTIIFMATLICLILVIIISKKIAKNIADPLAELEKIMNKFEAGEVDGNNEIFGNNEIAQLSQTFSNMSRRIKNLLQKIEEDQTELRKSKLKALYAQINPHLLYNSLDTIIWAAEQNENDKVIKMTSALAKYFRLSLSKGREVVPVFMEIEHIKNYLIIQKIRLIQPIVENAIYHGIKNLPGGGKIWIYGKRVDNNIHLCIKDNGVGMDEHQLETILTKKNDNNLKSGGVAISNVHQRLQLFYGKDYGLKFESELGKGTTVTIVIPIVDQPNIVMGALKKVMKLLKPY
ncbi:MAG TPA: sensor histidine kinase [Clostridiaceae bacterium]